MDVEQIAHADTSVTNGHPLRNAAYRRWLIGSGISLLGDQFYLVALPWLVLEKLGSATMLGALMMAGAIPRAALLLIGGVVTDRVSARWIMVVTAMTRALCVTVTGVLVAHGDLGVVALYLLVVIFGIADAFAMPAQSAFLPSILQSEQLVAGSGLSQGVAQLTAIVGPLCAGIVIAKLGVTLALMP
jgi:MFS family permease